MTTPRSSVIHRRFRHPGDRGFTLIELLVVVLILGILMAIAIPTFLNLTSGAKTNAAEADLTTAVQDEQTYFTLNSKYAAYTELATVDSGFTWRHWYASEAPGYNVTAGTHTVFLYSADNGATSVVLGTAGQDGMFYWLQDINGVMSYNKLVGGYITPNTAFGAGMGVKSSWKALG